MIAVTGATGHLGRLVLENLLERGMEPARIAALVRSPEKAADLAARGVQVRRADYSQPETLGPALQGVERLLLSPPARWASAPSSTATWWRRHARRG